MIPARESSMISEILDIQIKEHIVLCHREPDVLVMVGDGKYLQTRDD